MLHDLLPHRCRGNRSSIEQRRSPPHTHTFLPLPLQVRDRQAQEAREAADRAREGRLISSEVEAHRADEAALAEAARVLNVKAKQERRAQVGDVGRKELSVITAYLWFTVAMMYSSYDVQYLGS